MALAKEVSSIISGSQKGSQKSSFKKEPTIVNKSKALKLVNTDPPDAVTEEPPLVENDDPPILDNEYDAEYYDEEEQNEKTPDGQ